MPGTEAGSPPFADVVTDVAELEQLYGPPAPAVRAKKIDHVDPGAASIIAACPLVLVGTADEEGRCTVSPRGGPPGFVRVLDPHRLVLPDAAGNRLLDSSRNLLARPEVGLLFVLPGRAWTLRVQGRAWLTRDPEVLAGRPVGIGVQVQTAFVHCGRALDLSKVWDADTWDEGDVPDLLEVFRGHLALNGVGPAAS